MAAISAALALGSAIFSWRIMRRQDKRAAVSLRLAHDNDIIRWSDSAIAVLAEAHEILIEKGASCPDADFQARRSACRATLSAVIDRGRLFFPNVDRGDSHGAENEAGYRGHRQPVLEALVSAYQLLGSAGAEAGPDKASAEKLMQLRRTFVAEVFKAVEPERRGVSVKKLAT
jgi:hypothetical protein